MVYQILFTLLLPVYKRNTNEDELFYRAIAIQREVEKAIAHTIEIEKYLIWLQRFFEMTLAIAVLVALMAIIST